MDYRNNGQVTDDVTWSPKLL